MTNPFATDSEARYAEQALRVGQQTNIVRHGRFRYLESVEDALGDALDDLKHRLAVAMRYFPRLWEHPVTVGVLEEHEERHRSGGKTNATALCRNFTIHVRTDERLSNSTLFHELAHLEIAERDRRGADLPTSSEPFCDLYAVARMPPGLLFDDDGLYYIGQPDVPRDDWPEHCRDALAYRDERGANSHYIQRAKELLAVGGGGA